ncbi:hypothetical protein HaLaN_27698 [Haematococcus lacustris]|uniref:Uncharacterized protein n=1 Tax=Haematococcus lacustris TaxID=44745 RepID=A0A6A0AAI0_HAELA|nr:hypothetical protein HaLaN_27698 [Haematococcus lacustris]
MQRRCFVAAVCRVLNVVIVTTSSWTAEGATSAMSSEATSPVVRNSSASITQSGFEGMTPV